ncbi:MAG TPA: 4-alpha-glucanotransferase [Chitinophagaceae bacterium]|nr:4-alpha-glucanotransferase [Chitinophagaceae bacterium]
MKIQFYLRFHTEFGQSLWIRFESGLPGGESRQEPMAMTYLNEEFWFATLELPARPKEAITYKYLLKGKDGEWVQEWGNDRVIPAVKTPYREMQLVDTWNHAGEFENAFFLAPFQEILLKSRHTRSKTKPPKQYTHIFRVKAPLLHKHEVICLAGNGEKLGHWSTVSPHLFALEGNWWTLKIDLSGETFPIAYKYGVFNTREEKFVRFEGGNNRLLYGDAGEGKLTLLHDGFAHLPNDSWKGAGVAIPVFSLRSKSSFGIGEFNDLRLLADWARRTGLRLIQILPVNDTTATHTWSDTYPYAAISAFALHPAYIHLEAVAGKKYQAMLKPLKKKQKQLNGLPEVDYEQVMRFKIQVLRELYDLQRQECLDSEEYQAFFQANRHWLVPYAVFCYLRDKYGTSHFDQWKADAAYNEQAIEKLSSPKSRVYPEIAFHYFVQYHLHCQLKDAADYLHKHGIILKGDIPIGVYRYGCDAWMAPDLFNRNMQAGAPPDDFALRGQNWGFPTYNWKRMQEDGFAWWQRRFEQMSNYFDAFRIDHILGFFRIWSIPMHSLQGVMGRFVPAIPVRITEFGERSIWFDYHRYCQPFITEEILGQLFGELAGRVKAEFVRANEYGTFDLAPGFETQRQVENHFAGLEPSAENDRIREGLHELISNVLLFEEEGSQGDAFHFRIAMDQTLSFRYLDGTTQARLRELYVDYFYRRQDDFWRREALHKLPQLKASTNMLICGEDLGMVPHCVPEVMRQLGILSLEIQRMPKNPATEFFHPNDAPYLSVVTPSTHDMSTIRGWWEEDRARTQRFYNFVMGQWGEAPYFCEAWINRAIVLQHLYSPAMWSIFQLQDLLGMHETLRRQNPHEERINIPAISRHYWRYRMHLTLEDLIGAREFNQELADYITHSGRG